MTGVHVFSKNSWLRDTRAVPHDNLNSEAANLTGKARQAFGPLVVLTAATSGMILSLYSYFAPLTGVTGSAGALLVTASSLALMIDAPILWRSRSPLVFWIFWLLGVFGALGTLAAAYFLHSWWLLGANFIALAGLFVTLAPRLNRKEAAE